MAATPRDVFSDQFEPIDGDYLYRRRHKDAPIRITRGELELFLDRFDRAQSAMMWGGAVAGLVMAAPVAAVALLVPEEFQDWSLLAICVGLVGVVLIVSNWIWDAPGRTLKDRPPFGPPFSPNKARRLGYARLSYPRLGFGMVVFASAPFLIPSAREPAWLFASAAMVVFLLVHLIRKWTAEHAPD